METNGLLFVGIAIALLGAGGGTGRTDVGKPGALTANALPQVYAAEIGVREATGNNDGPRVVAYLRYCGLAEGYEWCAAFVSWCHGQAGYPGPRNAWAAALFPSERTVWAKAGATAGGTPRAGDVFGIYIASKKRIGHCGFVDGWNGKWCITVEGNVSNAVVRKRRPVRTIHAVSRWH
ncbi:CHAP domain-containing protein [Parapedobacter sp. 2B3]|uniref:CHAP domain-containing protein n=1 Tax=Parapedobacter sp. 2B3 TaxID=3342381 RepID=UPI0035B60E21